MSSPLYKIIIKVELLYVIISLIIVYYLASINF
jgi:hypothetical protein